AADGLQSPALAFGFDAFGQSTKAQRLTQGDYCLADGRIARIVGQCSGEALVDLEGVEGQFLEIGQRGIAGAEIIHGQLQIELLELVQQGCGGVPGAHDEAFGQLQFEVVGGQPGRCQAPLDAGPEITALNLNAGYVDRDAAKVDA